MLSHNHTESSTEPLSRNAFIDGILWGGNRWSDNTISYSFSSGNSLDGTQDWNRGEREVFEAALASWEAVIDIEFVLVEDDDPNANFKLNLATNIPDNILGFFGPPGEANAGEGYFNWQELGGENFADLEPGSFGFMVIIHEIGHGLGLAHPHDRGGESNLFPGLYSSLTPETSFGSNGLNQGIWTTMSYNPGLNDRGVQGSPMAFDIAAVQHLYGENREFAAGDDTYTLPTSNTGSVYYQGIWDTGGVDEIIAPRTRLDTTIDLRNAPLVGSNAGGYVSAITDVYGGFTIANGVEIENAQGSLGDDELIGNQLANELVGNDGEDRLIGGTEDDILVGGNGNDTLVGIDADGFSFGSGEYDRLTGNAGADIFVLGDSQEIYYQGRGYGTIIDLDNAAGDTIQLSGAASEYTFHNRDNGTFIRHDGDAIGFVVGENDLLENAELRFV
ncbi:MAG: M10 family metallopeptidase [Cyanobacteria bacterium J06623_7]